MVRDVKKIANLLILCSIILFSKEALAVYKPESITPIIVGSVTDLKIYDLWQVILTSVQSANPSSYYRIKLTLLTRDGEPLISMWTSSFQMEDVTYYIDANEVNRWGRVDIEVVNRDWWALVSQSGGGIPHGDYKVVYTILETNEECDWTGGVIARAENLLSVQPIVMIFPVHPENADTIEEVSFFSWIENSGNSWFYSVKVVPVSSVERIEVEAMTVQPLWESSSLSEQVWDVSGHTPHIEEGLYAWYVTAYADLERTEVVATSPISYFYYKEKILESSSKKKNINFDNALWVSEIIDEITVGRGDTIKLMYSVHCNDEPQVYLSKDGKSFSKVAPLVSLRTTSIQKVSLSGEVVHNYAFLMLKQCSRTFLLRIIPKEKWNKGVIPVNR
ncbi:MAG: hypothetical protein GXO48_07060 [Chlorobi bacterium]|nr:hypothetical protein [Chlorobiota bacterium]